MPQKKNNSNNSEKPQNAYFLSIELENVRCFSERQKIDFSDENGNPKQWTIILGDNGTGKTSILQSLIALSPLNVSEEHLVVTPPNLNNPKKRKEQYVTSLIGYDSDFRKSWNPLRSLDSKLTYRDDAIIAWANVGFRVDVEFFIGAELSKKSNKIKRTSLIFVNFTLSGNTSNKSFNSELRKMFCFAYGASRRAGETSFSDPNEESYYKTLFDESILLLNPEEWLIRSNYESLLKSEFQEERKRKLNKVKEVLIKILPDIEEIKFSEKTNNNKSQPIVKFKTHYGWVEAKDLSLGYRTSMAWMVDFASRMFDLYPESENPLAEPAVVLIDEIDLHLHPKWQRELIDYLSNLFPNTQFIVTTHSPLIVQAAAARNANFAVCRREGDHVVIDQTLDAVKNWRTDQILTSDLFGLESSRAKEIEKDLFERQQILTKAKLTKKDEKRLKEIEAKVGSVPMMENPLYDKMMDVISRASEKLEKEHKNGK